MHDSPLDYARSFLWFVINTDQHTRIQLDARCVVTDRKSGASEEFFLITPCKSEHMWVESKLFQEPNYDFCAIYSRSRQMILRTWSAHDPARAMERQVQANLPYYNELRLDVSPAQVAQPLTKSDAVVEATMANREMVVRTTIDLPGAPASAVVEYPLKTVNLHVPTRRVQIDTGPLLFPLWVPATGNSGETQQHDLGSPAQFTLAFICSNTWDRADFVLPEPTPVPGSDSTHGPRVWHYSRLIRALPVRHEFFATS